ncbi:UNVERIFIED_CONTAM: hypothetical protein HDU68_003591 [Siphonaria sp. JEL0065]|nr:hypothetical protein HDU68_003591 [Siphonaria sp. JEL0065]
MSNNVNLPKLKRLLRTQPTPPQPSLQRKPRSQILSQISSQVTTKRLHSQVDQQNQNPIPTPKQTAQTSSTNLDYSEYSTSENSKRTRSESPAEPFDFGGSNSCDSMDLDELQNQQKRVSDTNFDTNPAPPSTNGNTNGQDQEQAYSHEEDGGQYSEEEEQVEQEWDDTAVYPTETGAETLQDGTDGEYIQDPIQDDDSIQDDNPVQDDGQQLQAEDSTVMHDLNPENNSGEDQQHCEEGEDEEELQLFVNEEGELEGEGDPMDDGDNEDAEEHQPQIYDDIEFNEEEHQQEEEGNDYSQHEQPNQYDHDQQPHEHDIQMDQAQLDNLPPVAHLHESTRTPLLPPVIQQTESIAGTMFFRAFDGQPLTIDLIQSSAASDSFLDVNDKIKGTLYF